MGFLDNLVSDLVKSSTGINSRRFVRMVGGKNILLLGGAAVAGALAASQMGRKTPPPPPTPGRQPSVPPPPPILGTETIAHPPPPGPSEAVPQPASTAAAPETPEPTAEGTEAIPHDLLWAIVRTMVAAALADGRLGDEEKALIEKRLDDSGLSQDRIGQLHLDLMNPPSTDNLACLVSSREDCELLYRFGCLVVLANKDVSELEKMWLQQLAQALDIPPERKEMLEWEIFL